MMENAMKYKVGDKVRVMRNRPGYLCEGLQVGCVTDVVGIDYDKVVVKAIYDNGAQKELSLWLEDIELATDVIDRLTFAVDIPTQAMKEFADHCERAAAALERIKDILA